MNLNLSSVLFSSVISGTAGETGAEYKLTLLDSNMGIQANGTVVRNGKTVTIPYTISGDNSGNASRVSVLVLDKKYTAGNTNGAKVLDYQKLNVASFSTSGTGTYTLPDSLYRKACGSDYYMYILAEDVNSEKETDYASEPVAITPVWQAPTVKTINFGTDNIIDPAVPNSAGDAWTGCYVWYGSYDAEDDGTAEPVKYRVLDASTTDYSANGTTKTMFLDCDSILYYQQFDEDGTANATDKNANDWSVSDVKTSLNGDGFLNKSGVFTSVEKNAIASSTKDSHKLTTDSTTGVNVASWTQEAFVNYVALGGEQIFLLDAEDVSNGAYGYSITDGSCGNRKKTGSTAAYWWLRSASSHYDIDAGYVDSDGFIYIYDVYYYDPGVSPALNLNLESVIFSSANAVSKSSPLTSESAGITTTTGTDWKLTLKDTSKTVNLTEGRSVTKANDGTITVPYTYTDSATTDAEKANQISVMVTDKAYDASKDANAQEAQILYYGALTDIKNDKGETSTVAESTTGTGTFSLPSGLTGTMGVDYHIYLLAEHVNVDDMGTDVDESKNTDYAGEPVEVTTILDEIDTVAIPSIDAPTPEEELATEVTINSTGVKETAALTWKKVTAGDTTETTGNAEWKTTYKAYITLTAAEGYAFTASTGATGKASVEAMSTDGVAFDAEEITLNDDGTLTIYLGEYTSATRKTTGVTAPEVPEQFTSYYTADDVLASEELKVPAKVTLEGTTQPNPVDMEVEWSVVGANGESAAYDATPLVTNTFKWTVKESEYAEYDLNGMVLTGTVTIQNKDYTPVTISGSDVTITYDGSDTLDVSKYFTFDENAGTPTYELVDTSTGKGTLDGKNLTMTTLGTFVVKVNTAINRVYDKGEHTLTITVEKATPDVTELPAVADRTYHPTEALADTDLQGGTVKDVNSETLAGTWSWKKTEVVATADNNGYVAVFTPDDTIRYGAVEKNISVKVSKATPYIVEVPSAEAVTYGETLNDSVLSGGVVQYSEDDDTEVVGTWSFKEADTKPTVADSEVTQYEVTFTPTDADNYNVVESKITIVINKAEVVPNKPESTMDTIYTNDTIGKVTLPEGWTWKEEDKTKALEVGKAVTATAIYNGADKGNYVTESVEISITRQACTHTWDEGVVTKEPTATEKGEMTHTCTVCKATKTEEVAALGAPAVGTKVASDDGKATYKVTTSDVVNGTVAYVAQADKKATKVIIPDTVVIDGVTYKVTSIEKNAFKNNKKLKTLKLGKNVITIGDKAFYKCTALTKVTIPDKVKTIGKQAFYGCKNLKTVTIGKGVTKIGSKAFYGCKKLKTLIIKSKKLTTKKIGSKAFSKTPKSMTVKVPKKKYKSYKPMLIKRGVNKKAKFKKI